MKRWSPNSTESEIDAAMAEHLKHAPGRAWGGVITNNFSDAKDVAKRYLQKDATQREIFVTVLLN